MAPDQARSGNVAVRRGLRYFSVVLLFAIGTVHLDQYFVAYYKVIPIIGPLFLANFVVAILLGLALLAPLERIPRIGPALLALAAVSAIGFAATTLISLELSEHGTLFGFHEDGYRLAITLSLVLEAATIILLTAFLIMQATASRAWPQIAMPRSPAHQPAERPAHGSDGPAPAEGRPPEG